MNKQGVVHFSGKVSDYENGQNEALVCCLRDTPADDSDGEIADE
jgi:hypothetical protein